MQIIIAFTIIMLPVISYAQDYGCASVGASMEMVLFEKLSEDLEIDTSIIQRDKTQVKIIDILPVSKKYSESLARVDYNNDPDKDKTENKYNEIYLSSYYENQVKSITAKYIYFDKTGKKDIFIASSLMNKDECSIRFNGYITLSRDF